MKEALKYLSQTDASLGGTDVLAPLADIYQKKISAGYRRDILLITDGEISNENEVMELVKRHTYTTTLSTVGIGSGPNEFLIKGVARAAGGASELIAPKERIEPKVLRLFQKIMAGSISSIKIDCGIEIDQSPVSPSAYIHQPTSFFAKLKNDKVQNKSVKVTGSSREGLREWIINLEEVNNQDLPISKLWAREKIREFEEGNGLLPGSQQKQRGDDKNHKAIIDISREYGIISKSTSFVGIEKKSDTEEATSDMVLRVVPTLVTDGWHGGRSNARYSVRSQTYFKKTSINKGNTVSEPMFKLSKITPKILWPDTEPLISFSRAARGVRKVLSNIKGNDPLLDILSLQRAGGGFDADVLIGDLLRISLPDLQVITDKIDMKNHPDRMRILLTAIVLTILELKYGERRNEWDGVVSKSRNWLQDEVAKVKPTIDQEPFEDWVKKFVKERLGIIS
jgi:hypothetical protein